MLKLDQGTWLMPHPRYKLWEEKCDQVTELLTKALLGQPIGHGKKYGQGYTPHIGHVQGVFFDWASLKKLKYGTGPPPNTKIWLSPILVLPQQVINLSKTCFKLV